MKTLTILMGVLAMTTMVYGFTERLREFKKNMVECYELCGNLPEAVRCALDRDGKILDKNGEFILGESLKALGDGVSNLEKLKLVRSIFMECYKKGTESGSRGIELTRKIVKCGMPILDYLDKVD